jgi:FkbM family methyltransferase
MMHLKIPVQLRKPLKLVEKSVFLQLASFEFQSSEQQRESRLAALKSLGSAFETRNFEDLYRSVVELTRGDGTISRVSLSSSNTQLHALNDGAEKFQFGYEPEIAAVIDLFVPNDGTLVDAGANFGYFSLYLALRSGFSGLVHAFEPSARGFADLEQLVASLGAPRRIHIHKMALGDSSGYTELLQSSSDGLTTMMPSMANRFERVWRQQPVELRKLDEFGIRRLDLLKIDVEGAETRVIAGAAATIRACQPVVIFESWSFEDDRGAFVLLGEAGYRFFVPGWLDGKGQFTTLINQDPRRDNLILLPFAAESRRDIPQRIDVVAVPDKRLALLSPDMLVR